MSTTDWTFYVSFSQFIFSFFVSCFVITNLTIILHRLFKHQGELVSLPMVINICCWVVTSLFGLTYSGSSLVAWTLPGEYDLLIRKYSLQLYLLENVG